MLGGMLGVLLMVRFVSEGTLPGPKWSVDACELPGGGDMELIALRPWKAAALLEVVVGGEGSREELRGAVCGSLWLWSSEVWEARTSSVACESETSE